MIGKMIYDINNDEMKEATQNDVDHMFEALQTSGLMVKTLRFLIPEIIPPSSSQSGVFIKQLKANLNTYLRHKGIDV